MVSILLGSNTALVDISNDEIGDQRLSQVENISLVDPSNPEMSCNLVVDYDQINRIIETSLNRALQNFTLSQPSSIDEHNANRVIESNVRRILNSINLSSSQGSYRHDQTSSNDQSDNRYVYSQLSVSCNDNIPENNKPRCSQNRQSNLFTDSNRTH